MSIHADQMTIDDVMTAPAASWRERLDPQVVPLADKLLAEYPTESLTWILHCALGHHRGEWVPYSAERILGKPSSSHYPTPAEIVEANLYVQRILKG